MNIKKLLKEAYFFCQNNKLESAENIYHQILKKFPNNFEALANLGLILIQKKNFIEAEKTYAAAMKIQWDTAVANNYFNILLNNNKIKEAEEINQELIDKNQNLNHKQQEVNFINRARVLNAKGNYEEALKLYLNLFSKNPELNDLLIGIGYTYNRLKKYEEAIAAYEKILNKNSNDFVALYNLGITRISNRIDLKKGIRQLEEARKIVPSNLDLLLTLSSGYEKNNQIQEALKIAQEANNIRKNNSMVHYQIGSILNHMGDENGQKWLESSLKIDANNYRTIFTLSQIYLRENKYEEGMQLYRWRVKRIESDYKFDDTSIIEIEKDENVLIFFEQGIGDQIIFLRYIEYLLKTTRNIVIFIKAKLIDFVKQNIKEIKIYCSEDYVEKEWIEYKKINLGSLPRLLLTEIKKIPKFKKWNISKIKINTFDKKLSESKKKIIGISWKSSNRDLEQKKNIPLINLVKILEGYTLVNLQYGNVQKDIENATKNTKVKILNFSEIDLFNDINSLAQLIDRCDMVVTISNVNAHIAGVLGKKTYLLAPKSWGRLWYWTENKNKSLFYPSINIIDQDNDGDWDSSLMKLKKILDK